MWHAPGEKLPPARQVGSRRSLVPPGEGHGAGESLGDGVICIIHTIRRKSTPALQSPLTRGGRFATLRGLILPNLLTPSCRKAGLCPPRAGQLPSRSSSARRQPGWLHDAPAASLRSARRLAAGGSRSHQTGHGEDQTWRDAAIPPARRAVGTVNGLYQVAADGTISSAARAACRWATRRWTRPARCSAACCR